MDVSPPESSADLAHEIEVLRRDLAELREQQTATSEVLSVLGRSKSELEPLFETIVEHARRLSCATSKSRRTRDHRITHDPRQALRDRQAPIRDQRSGYPVR